MVNPIPERCGALTPYLLVQDANKAIDFYSEVFGAEETHRLAGPDGKSVMHAEMKISDSVFFIAGLQPSMGLAACRQGETPPVSLHLYVEDVDSVYDKAVAKGCRVVMPLSDTFWGDRFGKVVDPFGQHWSLATHIEDVSEEEMNRRAATVFQQG